MLKLRKIGKMSKPNNGSRNLHESIFNINVLESIKSIDTNLDFILINELAIGYYHKPFMYNKIDILVKDKSNINLPLNIYDPTDFGLSKNDYELIKKDSEISNDISIISPTYMIILLLKDGELNIDNRYLIDKLIYNNKIDFNLLNKYLKNTKDIFEFIKRNNKDYMLKYLIDFKKYNDCFIFEGTSGYPEVDLAFEDWVNNTSNLNQVLIGGMSIVKHGIEERSTQDVDFLFLSKEDIPTEVYKFKKNRNNAFQHKKTHVEIEVLSGDTINIEQSMVDLIFKTAYDKGNYKISSPSAIVALKLDRFSPTDERDISMLMKSYRINIDEFLPYMSDKAKNNWKTIK